MYTPFGSHGVRSDGNRKQHKFKAALLLQRTEDRKAANERRGEQAEKLEEEGNSHSRQGQHVEAIKKYTEAAKIYGLRPVVMSNLAAAYLKLEQYELAEWACDCALLHSPRLAEARYRRAMARKGQSMFKGAEFDLRIVVKHHPEITEARGELTKVEEDRKNYGDGQRHEPTYNEAFPPFDAEEWDPPLDSDSEDVKHTGNDRSCKFHNHGGCRKGVRCEFSHAPDDQSVRDDLGQNVCLRFLLGDCRSGDKCVYSHSKDYLPQGWWSTPKQVEEAKRLRAALDDPEGGDDHVTETLENTTAYGRLKKYQDYREDFKIYSALRSDVLTSRIKDKPSKAPSESPPKEPSRFVLLLCFQDLEMFTRINGHLLEALRAKAKVVYAGNATEVSTCLEAPELAGVIVGDAGITDRSKLSTVVQLVDYARSGGSVVFAGLFPSQISGSEFNRFFSQHFELQWKYGSYFRTTFYRGMESDVVKKNPSLEFSYSMKALHVRGITPDSVVYWTGESPHTRSLIPSPYPVTDLNESPAVSTRVGKGSVSFLGDENAEDESTKTILAMLDLLDSPPPPEPAPLKAETETERKKQTKKCKNKAEESHQEPPPVSTPDTSSTNTITSSNNPQRATLLHTRRFLMQLSLSDNELSDQFITPQIRAIKTKIGVRKVTTPSQASVLLSSSDLSGVYVTDCALTDQKYNPLLKELVSYVKDGGCLVFGGTFSRFAEFPHFASLFVEFGLDWKAAASTTETHDLVNNDFSEFVGRNAFLPKKISIMAVFLEGVEPHNMIYRLPHTTPEAQAPIAFSDVGRGHVGYIGDVSADTCTTPVLLAMFDLLKYPHPLRKPASHKFVIALVCPSFIDEYGKTPLFKELKEKGIEIITGEELSAPRIVDLLSSPDLLGVLALDISLVDLLSSPDVLGVLVLDDISVPTRRWFSHEVAAYVWSGGTLILCGDSAMTPPDELECFLTDCFCLPWQVSSATELPVKLNQENELVRRLPQAIKQESVYYEGTFLHNVDRDAVVYGSDPGLRLKTAAHVPVAYTTVGTGHVGFFGREEINELDTKLVLAMLGLVPLGNPLQRPM